MLMEETLDTWIFSVKNVMVRSTHLALIVGSNEEIVNDQRGHKLSFKWLLQFKQGNNVPGC